VVGLRRQAANSTSQPNGAAVMINERRRFGHIPALDKLLAAHATLFLA
jgi:hypothetical protein